MGKGRTCRWIDCASSGFSIGIVSIGCEQDERGPGVDDSYNTDELYTFGEKICDNWPAVEFKIGVVP